MWFLAGATALIGLNELSDRVSKSVSDAFQPVSDMIDRIEKESEVKRKQEIRENSVQRQREYESQTNDKLSKLDIKLETRSIDCQIVNNTEDPVNILFVNPDRVKDCHEAIALAKKDLDSNWFTRGDTKIHLLGVTNMYRLVRDEIEYYIVLQYKESFKVIEKSYFKMNTINVKEVFELKKQTLDIDIKCKGWLY